MGDVIQLSRARTGRAEDRSSRRRVAPGAFHFDLSSPFTYLAAERLERLLPGATWVPTLEEAVHGGDPWPDADAWTAAVARAESRARMLHLPLVWPDARPPRARAAMRAAAYAAERGRGREFALAAGRLAFCGGYDLEDPEVLAEAAAAAGIGLDDCLRAARDVGRDGAMERAGRALLARGADRLPALRVGGGVFCGEERIAEAAAAAAMSVRALPSVG